MSINDARIRTNLIKVNENDQINELETNTFEKYFA